MEEMMLVENLHESTHFGKKNPQRFYITKNCPAPFRATKMIVSPKEATFEGYTQILRRSAA